MMKTRCGTLLACLWTLSGGLAWAQDGSTYHFEGQSFQLHPIRVGERSAFSLDDPEVKRLIGFTSSQVQLSDSGQSLYVFSSGRQTSWSDDSQNYRLDNAERVAPGRYFASRHALEPSALWSALGLQASGTELRPVIIAAAATPADGKVTFKLNARVVFDSNTVAPGHLVCHLKDAAWESVDKQVQLGDVSVKVLEAGSDLTLDLTFPPVWNGRFHRGLTGDLELSEDVPSQARIGDLPASLEQAQVMPSDGGKSVQFSFSRAVGFGWAYQPDTRLLTVELPQVENSRAVALEGLSKVGFDNYPVERYQVTLDPGQTFDFDQSAGDGKLILKLHPLGTGTPPELVGSANMQGAQPTRGLIVLDPGHGGGDAGCYGRSVGVYEKDITLDICRRLQRVLEAQGWQVVMTREVDRDVTWAGSPDAMELQARADVANSRSADLFVSIHCNASVSNGPQGSAVYWYKPQDYELAQDLDVLGHDLGFSHVGLLRNRFKVLRSTDMPAVLVETAFLSNPSDAALLARPETRQSIAERLAGGIDHYFDVHIAQSRSRTQTARVYRPSTETDPGAEGTSDQP